MTENFLTATQIYNHSRLFMEAYSTVMRPLCEEAGLPQTAIDILLFLANNPAHTTARDISRYRNMKPAIISFHVERLVSEQYLERREVPGDRRKCSLVCTERALGIIEKGRAVQNRFAAQLTSGLSAEELALYKRCLSTFAQNLEHMKLEGLT